mmetsp:Transcript_31904/g.63255  ORF Transcript_31904/g.63255 Transcript_31904/m.63255 type:complete len:294 (-) Transcript_31904:197-1078(-)
MLYNLWHFTSIYSSLYSCVEVVRDVEGLQAAFDVVVAVEEVEALARGLASLLTVELDGLEKDAHLRRAAVDALHGAVVTAVFDKRLALPVFLAHVLVELDKGCVLDFIVRDGLVRLAEGLLEAAEFVFGGEGGGPEGAVVGSGRHEHGHFLGHLKEGLRAPARRARGRTKRATDAGMHGKGEDGAGVGLEGVGGVDGAGGSHAVTSDDDLVRVDPAVKVAAGVFIRLFSPLDGLHKKLPVSVGCERGLVLFWGLHEGENNDGPMAGDERERVVVESILASAAMHESHQGKLEV